jgi:hypothetical protein
VASADDSSTATPNNALLQSPTFPALGFSYSIEANSNSPGGASAWVSEFTTELRIFDQGADVRQFMVTVASDDFNQPGSAGDLLDLMNSLTLLSATTTSTAGTSGVLMRSFADTDSGGLTPAYAPGGSAVFTSSTNDIVDGLTSSTMSSFVRPGTFIVGSQAIITLAGNMSSSVQFSGMSEAMGGRAAVVPEVSSIVAWGLCIVAVAAILRRRRRSA